MMRPRTLLALWFGVALGSGASPADAQVVIDKVIGRVGSDIITQSDLRQARMLKLFGPPVTEKDSDAALLRAIENRRLILQEIERGRAADPPRERQAEQRRQWAARFGTNVDLTKALERGGMSETAIDDWCRNDARIESYLAERFKSVPASSRASEIDNWISELRRRAGLK